MLPPDGSGRGWQMVRGPVSMGIALVLMMFMFLLVGLGPRAFEQILPESAIVWLETMGGIGDMQGMALVGGGNSGNSGGGKTADDRVRDSSDGWKVAGPVAALAGGAAAFPDQVIAGYSTRVRGDSPGATTVLTPRADCRPEPPSAAAAFAHVAIAGDTGLDLGLSTYGDADLAAAAQVFVNVWRETGMKNPFPSRGEAYQAFDVAVTETAAPVYLVVEAVHGQRIVNLHFAPGARLERVVLLGGAQMGVANLPPGVPVEAIPASVLQVCARLPFYPLNPGHLFYQSVENGAIRADEVAGHEASHAAAVAGWEAAFRRMFGQGAGETLAGDWLDATLAVAGPLPATPEARAVWTPIEGAPVTLTVGQYVETAAMAREGKGFANRVEAIVRSFAWGDLELLSLPDQQPPEG